MFRVLLLRWLLLAVAIGLVAGLLPGVHISGGFWSLLWIAALFGIINITIGTLLRLLTLPLLVLTLGLFTFVVNAAVFALTAYWSDDLAVDNFGWDLLFALLVTIVAGLLNALFRAPVRRAAKA